MITLLENMEVNIADEGKAWEGQLPTIGRSLTRQMKHPNSNELSILVNHARIPTHAVSLILQIDIDHQDIFARLLIEPKNHRRQSL